MKKSKRNLAYLLVPTIGLIVFIAVYWNFDKGYEAKIARQAAEVKEKKNAEIEAQNRVREAAVKQAEADNIRRRAEKARKDAEKAKRSADLQDAYQASEKARRDESSFKDRVEKLKKDVATLKDEIAKINQDKQLLLAERDAVEAVGRKASSNSKNLTEVLDKIQAADTAWQNAQMAAATAAKNKKS